MVRLPGWYLYSLHQKVSVCDTEPRNSEAKMPLRPWTCVTSSVPFFFFLISKIVRRIVSGLRRLNELVCKLLSPDSKHSNMLAIIFLYVYEFVCMQLQSVSLVFKGDTCSDVLAFQLYVNILVYWFSIHV